MKILWFPRLQFDIDKLHITTWREMCRELEELGHGVKIAVAGDYIPGVFERDYIAVPIIKLKFLRIMSFWFNGFIRFIISYFCFAPDVIILDPLTVWFSLPFIVVPRKRRPLIIIDSRTPLYLHSVQTILTQRVLQWYTAVVFRYCMLFLDGMTVITEHFKEQVCRTLGFDQRKVGVWGSGVDAERFAPRDYGREEMPAFMKDKFVLMQHGQISYLRGVLETILALNILDTDEICLVLVGSVIGDTKLSHKIVEDIKRADMKHRVHILPPVSHAEIPRVLSYCDCAVLAYPDCDYWNNNNPIKLLEYMAMGKFIICSDMWTFRSVLGTSAGVYYVPENTPENIAIAIRYCYANRKELSLNGKANIQIVKEKYTWHTQAVNLLDFIGHLSAV